MDSPKAHRKIGSRRGVLLVVLLLVASACGADEGSSTTSAQGSADEPTSTLAPGTTEPSSASTAVTGMTANECPIDIPLRVGTAVPQTGGLAEPGTELLRGYELVIDAYNAEGALNGQTIEMEVQDDAGDAITASEIAASFGEDAGVLVVLGTYGSSAALSSSEVLESFGVPNIQPFASTAQMVERGLEYLFNTYPLVTEEMAFADAFIDDHMQPETIGVVYVNNEFGIDGRDQIVSDAEDLGWDVVVDEGFEFGAQDFGPIVQRIASENPDVLRLVMYSVNEIPFMRQMQERGVDVGYMTIQGESHFERATIDGLGDAADWFVASPQWFPGTPYGGSDDFIAEYEAEFGQAPAASAARGYAAAQLLIAALEDVVENGDCPSRESIRTALAGIDVETILGPTQFDDRNQSQAPFHTVQLQDLEIVHLYDGVAEELLEEPVPFVPWSDR